jgi:hypothetical protein
MKAITKPVLGAVIEIGVLKHTNAIYHKVSRKCHFASASTVSGAEALAEAPQMRALAKHFLAV